MEGTGRSRRRLRAFRSFAREVVERFCQDRISLAAGAISFFTLLSIVPLLLLAISILASVGVHQASGKIEALAATLGPQLAQTLREQLFAVVDHRGALTGLALAFGFWSGSQIFLTLESAMNLAWHSQRRRPFWKRRGLALLMVIIVGTLLLGAVLVTNLTRLLRGLHSPLLLSPVVDIVLLLTTSILIPLLLIFAIFTVVYRVLPTRRVTLRSVVPGALFAAALWLASIHIFGWYTANFAHYSVLYGSLGGLVLLLFWFYYSAFILLLGAEISAVYHQRLIQRGVAEERMAEMAEHAPEFAVAYRRASR